MGYTHYWTPKKTSAKKFKEFSDTCKKLHDNLPEYSESAGGYYNDEKIKIGNGAGENNKPEFSKHTVCFNGVGKNSHETFHVGLTKLESDFCKTARKPYDLLVVACLLAAVDFLDYTFTSDGFTDYYDERNSVKIHECTDLLPALNFYNEVMGTDYTEEHLWKIRKRCKS